MASYMAFKYKFGFNVYAKVFSLSFSFLVCGVSSKLFSKEAKYHTRGKLYTSDQV